MSRKRKLKKQLKRRAQWVENLENLYLRRADEAFLEAARLHFRELEAASVADLYREVADRALTGALTGGDPARVGELLDRIRREVASRPLVLLAEAVDLLAAGCSTPGRGHVSSPPGRGHVSSPPGRGHESAADRLAALDEATPDLPPGVPRCLPEMLRVLACSGSVPVSEAGGEEALWQEIGETARLSRALEAHAFSGTGRPRPLELEDPSARAVWDFYRALAALGARRFRPGAKTLAALARAVEAVRREAPVEDTLDRLLRETEKRLRVLTALHKLEQTARRSRRAKIEELVLERLDTAGSLLAKLLREPPPPLLRTLQHALRTRWRGLLELVFERRGSEGLAALFAARPETLAVDLDPGTEVAELRRSAEAKALLESGSFGELGAFLSSAGARVESAPRLAALWSLELWARHEQPWGVAGRASVHRTLVRLLEMTAALGRFAAVERPQVARFLRDELFELCHVLFFCGHCLTAAEALMEHLGDDPGLLVVALAGAVCSRDERARRGIAGRIAAHGTVRADRQSLLRLVDSIAAEAADDAVSVLTALEPLFAGDGWSEALDRAEAKALEGIRDGLIEAFEMTVEDPEAAAWAIGEARRDLDLYRPLLGERPELAALDVTVGCWGAEPSVAELHVRDFLRRFEELEPALVLFRQALELSAAEVCPIDPAVVAAVVDRLDGRWQLWAPDIASLAIHATRAQLRRLRKKIRGLSKDKTLDESEREAFRQLSKTIAKLSRLKTVARLASIPWSDFDLPQLEPPEEPEPGPGKPRARCPRPVDDRQLDLFEPE